MQKTALRLGALAAFALLTPYADAAGLGRITVNSALGQPFSAQIELVSVSREELGSLAARLASADAYRQASLQLPPDLTSLRFAIQQRAGGQPYVVVTSTRPVSEPVVDLLVELAWANGRISRAYTVFIDPPADLRPAAPAIPAPVGAPVTASPEPETRRIPPVAGAVQARPVAPIRMAPARTTAATDREYGPLKRGETLASVAASTRPDGVTLEQMLVGLYRTNPDAFIGNMNRMKSGRILRVPEKEELVAVTPREALQEVRVQARDWNAYRNRLADTAAHAQEGNAASGRISARVEDQGPASGSREVVRLSKSEGPGVAGGKGGKGAKPSTADRLRVLEEEAVAREKALSEAQERIVQLEKTIREQQRLLTLKGAPLGTQAAGPEAAKPAPDQPAAPSPPTPAAAQPGATVSTEPAAKPEAPVPAAEADGKTRLKPVPPPAPAPAEPEFLDVLLEEPLYLGAAGGVLLLALLYSVLARRRRAGVTRPRGGASAPAEPAKPLRAAPALVPGIPALGDAAHARTLEPVIAHTQPGSPVMKEAANTESHATDPLDLDLSTAIEPEPEREPAKAVVTPITSAGEPSVPAASEPVMSTVGTPALRAVPSEPEIPSVVIDLAVANDSLAKRELPAASASEPVLPDFEFEIPPPTAAEVSPAAAAMDATPAPVVTESNVIDFKLDLPPANEPDLAPAAAPTPAAIADTGIDFKLDFGDIDLTLDAGATAASAAAGADKDPHWHDVQQKFDLAKAYEEMGDKEGAREVLQEVLGEGDEEQRAQATRLLDTLV